MSDPILADLFWEPETEDTPATAFRPPKNRDEVRMFFDLYFGVRFPEKAYCAGHSAPFDVLCEAYFAEVPSSVWKATRGLAGKTHMMAALSLLETLSSYDVVLLSGSGEQSQRAHKATASFWNNRTMVWACPGCRLANYVRNDICTRCGEVKPDKPLIAEVRRPEWLLKRSPLKTRTMTVHNNEMVALTASTKAARGPHPHRIRMDEVDEMDLEILDAAMGQVMITDPAMKTQTVFASTHHRESGAMSEVIMRARRNNWPVREWCYRETMLNPDNPGSWLMAENIEAKRHTVTSYMWRTEYDLETPDEGGSVFGADSIDNIFPPGGIIEDTLNHYFEIEAPVPEGSYVTGADWGRKTDLSVIVTFRIDVTPWRMVAFERLFRKPWRVSQRRYDIRMRHYGSEGIHDGTGYGDVMGEILETGGYGYQMNSAERYSRMFIQYALAAEKGLFIMPRFEALLAVHKGVKTEDLTYGLRGHPPDEIVACSLAILRGLGLHDVDSKSKPGVIGRIRTF